MVPLTIIVRIGKSSEMFASVLVICACVVGVVIVFGII